MSSIVDIARQAGVSHMTVSNVLSGRSKPRRSDAVVRAARIRRIADEMGYRPSGSARAMRSGRFNAVSMLTNERSHPSLSPLVLGGVGEVLAKREVGLVLEVLSHAEGDLDEESVNLPHFLRQAHTDGMLVHDIKQVPARVFETMHHHQIPAIWMESRLDADCVYFDDRGGMTAAVGRLAELGHRRIGYVGPAPEANDHHSVADRAEGYARAMTTHELVNRWLKAPRQSRFISADATPAAELVADWLGAFDNLERPTAVVAYDTLYAGAVLAAAARGRLDVPRDLSVIAFGSQWYSTGWKLALAYLDARRLGRAGAEAILAKIDDPSAEQPPHVLDVPILDHATLAPPPERTP